MASFEEIMGKYQRRFALTGRAFVLQPVDHALLPMARCVFIVKS
jgi:hypothetical protein